MALNIKTKQVGLDESIQAAVNRINRRGLNVKIKASDYTQPLGKISQKADEFTKSLEASNARVIAFGASAAIIGGVAIAFKELVVQSIKVEKILTDINVVLNTSLSNLQKFGNDLFKVARNTSQGLEVAAEAALEFSRQGLSMEETLRRTNDALILTRLTGIKAADAVSGLTAAVNGFADAGLTTTNIINKLAAVDVKFAVSADDLIDALARAGAVAQDAGVNFDQLVGAVTSAQQITARGGAVIGNSFKTIFTRIQRGSTLDRLEELGVAVRDIRGQTLPALTVLQSLAKSYDKLGSSTKAAVAEQVGGVFQINVLKAALKDLNRESSLYSQATKISTQATDQAQQKNEQLQKTISSLATQTSLTIQELSKNIGDLALAPGISNVLEAINSLAGGLNDLFGKNSEGIGSDFAKGLIKGLGNVITGPGLVLVFGVFGKLFANALKFAKSSLKDILGIVDAKTKEKQLQESIIEALQRNKTLAQDLSSLSESKEAQEKYILKIINDQTAALQAQQNIARTLAPGLIKKGVQPDLTRSPRKSSSTSGASSGLVPESDARAEKDGARRSGYVPGNVRSMRVQGLGNVVYNDAESVKHFNGLSQPAIMPPKGSRAGHRYQSKFVDTHGFDPYSFFGLIPNFADSRSRDQKINDTLNDPANKGIRFNLQKKQPQVIKSKNMWDQEILRMFQQNPNQEYLGSPLIDYLSNKGYNKNQLQNLAKNPSKFKIMNDGFVPNFSLGAQQTNSTLSLPKAKMYVQSSDSKYAKGGWHNISTTLNQLKGQKGAKELAAQFMALETLGIKRISRPFYFTKTGDPGGKIGKSAKSKQKKLKGGDKSRIPGDMYEDEVGINFSKRGYIQTPKNANVDFVRKGRNPIEAKFNDAKSHSLIAKSLKLTADKYIENFLSDNGMAPFSDSMRDLKQDLALNTAESIWGSRSSSNVEQFRMNNGFVPNFRTKNTMKKNLEAGRNYEQFVGKIFGKSPTYNAPMDFYGPLGYSPKYSNYIGGESSPLHISRGSLGYDFLDAHSGAGHSPGQLFKKFINSGIFNQSDIDDFHGLGLPAEEGKPIDLTNVFTEISKKGKAGVNKRTHKGIPFLFKRDVFNPKHSGFVPNFANALQESIDREMAAGIPKSMIRVSQDDSLRNSSNPMGLGIMNTRDEPLGLKQGIRRSKRLGIDPRTHGANGGLIPNFQNSDSNGMSKLFGLTSLAYAIDGVVSSLDFLGEEGKKTAQTFTGVAQGATQGVLVASAFQEIGQNSKGVLGVLGKMGPLAGVVAAAIPIFSALKENTTWFDNSLDSLNKSAAKTSKGLDSLSTAISKTQDIESTKNEITELNNSASLTTFDGQLKKLELETKLAKQNTELSKSANGLSKDLNLSSEEVQLMTSGTAEGMKALQEAQLLYARKLNGIQVSKGLQRDESKRGIVDKIFSLGPKEGSFIDELKGSLDNLTGFISGDKSTSEYLSYNRKQARRPAEDFGLADRTDATILRDTNSVESSRILAARSLGSSVSMNESSQDILDIDPDLSGSKYLEGIKKNVETALKSGDANQEGAAIQIQQLLEGIGDDPSLQKEGSEDLKAIYGLLKKYKSQLEKDESVRKGNIDQSRKIAAMRAKMATVIEQQFQAEKNRLDIISTQQGLDRYIKDLDNQYKIKAGIVTKSNQVEMEMAAKRQASDEKYTNDLANINNERVKAVKSEISKFANSRTSTAFNPEMFSFDPEAGKGLSGEAKKAEENKDFVSKKSKIKTQLQLASMLETGSMNPGGNILKEIDDAPEFEQIKLAITDWLKSLAETGKSQEMIENLQKTIFNKNSDVLTGIDTVNKKSAGAATQAANLKNIEDKKIDASEEEVKMKLGTLGYLKDQLNTLRNTPHSELDAITSENLQISKGLSDIEYENLKNRQIYTRDGQGLVELQAEQKSIALTSVAKEYESLFITGQRLVAEEELRKKYREYKAIIEQKVANEIKTMGFSAEDDTELLKQQREQKYFSIKADTDYALAVNAAARTQEEFNANLDNGRFLLDAKHEMAEAERDYTRTLVKLKAKLGDNFFFEEGQRSVGMKKSTDQREMQTLQGKRAGYMAQGSDIKVAETDLDIARKQKEMNIELGREALFRDSITERIRENNVALERFGETLANTTFDAVESGFDDLFQNLLDGTMSTGDAFKNFAGGIAQAVGDALRQRAIKQITTGLFEAIGFAKGGLVGYASGGSVGGSNQVPSMLTNGEYVVKKKIVDRLGTNTFNQINKSGSLDELYNQPNEDMFDISTEGSAETPMFTQMSGGDLLGKHLLNSKSEPSSSSIIESGYGFSGEQMQNFDQIVNKFNGGVVSLVNHLDKGGQPQEDKFSLTNTANAAKSSLASNANDSSTMKIAKGAGTLVGQFLATDRGDPEGPKAPEPPKKYQKLNLSSSLDINPESNMMSARYKSKDQYRKKYGQYLLDKYEYDVDTQNQKVMNRANQLSSLAGGLTSLVAAKGLNTKFGEMKEGMKAGMGRTDYMKTLKQLPNDQQAWKDAGRPEGRKTGRLDYLTPQVGVLGKSNNKDFSGSGAISGGKTSISNSNLTQSEQFIASQKSRNSTYFNSNMQDLSDYAYGDTENWNNGGSVIGSTSYFNKGGSVHSSISNPYSYFNRGGSVRSSYTNNPYSYFNRGGSVHSSISNPYSYFNRGGSVYSSNRNDQSIYNATSNPYAFNSNSSNNENNILYSSNSNQNPYSYSNRGSSTTYNNGFSSQSNMSYMSNGGKVSGPGGIDKVGPVMLDKGEYVIKASSVQNIEKKTPGFFNRLNAMKMNQGGVVSNSNDPISNVTNTENSPSSSNNVTININVSSDGTSTTSGGEGANEQEMAAKIKDAVVGIINQEKRVGGSLRGK